jgi:importin-9
LRPLPPFFRSPQTLAKIQVIFPDVIQSQEFFNACWNAIQAHSTPYYASYIDGDFEGGLINQYHLPFTLDFLVIEEIDYLQTLLDAPDVVRQLKDMQRADDESNGSSINDWIMQILGALVAFSSITEETQEMWEIDFNVFLSEETFAETNNTPRSVCAGFVWKICDWYPRQTLESLLAYIKVVFGDQNST